MSPHPAQQTQQQHYIVWFWSITLQWQELKFLSSLQGQPHINTLMLTSYLWADAAVPVEQALHPGVSLRSGKCIPQLLGPAPVIYLVRIWVETRKRIKARKAGRVSAALLLLILPPSQPQTTPSSPQCYHPLHWLELTGRPIIHGGVACHLLQQDKACRISGMVGTAIQIHTLHN